MDVRGTAVLYALYRTILYYTVLHYTASYYTVLLHSVDNCTTILLYYYATTCIQLDMHLHDHTTPLNTPAHNYGTYCTCTAAPNTREHARHHARRRPSPRTPPRCLAAARAAPGRAWQPLPPRARFGWLRKGAAALARSAIKYYVRVYFSRPSCVAIALRV